MTRWLAAALILCAPSIQASVWASEPPRLAGTIVTPGQRVALFALTPGGIVPVGIGEPVGDYLVREIGPGHVQLQGAGQRIIVSVEGAAMPLPPPDTGGATFGLVLHQQGPPDD